MGALVVAFMVLTIWGGYWEGLSLNLPIWDLVSQNKYIKYGILGILAVAAGYGHFSIRRRAATNIINKESCSREAPDLITEDTSSRVSLIIHAPISKNISV